MFPQPRVRVAHVQPIRQQPWRNVDSICHRLLPTFATVGASATVRATKRFEARHGRRDDRADAFRGLLDLAVADMSISERHDRLRMTEHPGDGGQRYAPRDGLARYRMAQVVQAHILDPGFTPYPRPETQITGLRPCRIPRRRKDERASGSRLAGDNGLRRPAQPDRARPGLRLGQSEHVAVDLRPSKRQDFALPAAGQQQEADDVGLRPARGPFLNQPVQGPVEPGYLFCGQEPGHLPARVRSDACNRIGPDMAGGFRRAHDLAQHGKRDVGRARRLAAHVVEPAFDMRPADAIKAKRPEGGHEPGPDYAVHTLAPARTAMAPVCRKPVLHDEIPEERNGSPAGRVFGAKRMRAVEQGPACGPGFLHRHQHGRTDGRSHHPAPS